MSHFKAAALLTIYSFFFFASGVWAYSGGTGEPNNPYRIATAADLNDIGNHSEDFNKCFIVTNSINLAAYTGGQFKVIGNSSQPFTGIFDGNNQEILNFTHNSTGINEIGLFGHISGSNAVIKNITLVDVNVYSTGWYTGGLAGYSSGTISNCSCIGSISGKDITGGLVGINYQQGNISNCWSSGKVTGTFDVGGLVGHNESGGTIQNSYSTANVTSTVSSGPYAAGGLVGMNYGGNSTISKCYSTGKVVGNGLVGGLVGWSYASPTLDSYWDTQTSEQSSSDGGTGKTTAQMKTKSTFTDAGWDLVEIWNIGENQTYPYLRTCSPADINQDNVVNFFDFAVLASHWLEGVEQ